ncbi:MAG TPA: hypothetical protein VLK30_05930 [Candidatus Limnocylindrales bacterium]|nr:hypothetical protein [Candidatus Limnocylindrales bacterium]
MNRLKHLPSMAAAAAFGLLPLSAGATATPSPTLDTVLAAPPSSDFNELTSSPLNGKFTAHDFATLNGNSTAATNTENSLNHDGFVDGFAKTWTQASSGHGLIEAVLAFAGGRGAKDALTGLEAGDKADASYKHADTITGISPYYGAHFADSTNNVIEDFYAFAKGNDVFAVLFVSSKDDVADLAVSQARAQYDHAPASTIPISLWPENSTGASTFPVLAFAIGAAFIVVVVPLVLFLVLRRRTPAMTGAYAMGGMPGATYPGFVAPVDVQMSPDGNYWWDGQTWKDAAQEAPPHAQRSSDSTLWWDGRNWRPMPQAAQPQPPAV